MLLRWTFIYHQRLKVWVKSVFSMYLFLFFKPHRTFPPLCRDFLHLNAFSLLSTFYFLHLGLSPVPRFSFSQMCLQLQNTPCPCPIAVCSAPLIRWIIACSHFTWKQYFLPSNLISLLEPNWVTGSKIIPEDNSTEVNTVDLTLCFPHISRMIFKISA